MMDKKQIRDWIDTLEDGSNVAIDEGGLSLVEIGADGTETGAYLEVGMAPSEDDGEDDGIPDAE